VPKGVEVRLLSRALRMFKIRNFLGAVIIGAIGLALFSPPQAFAVRRITSPNNNAPSVSAMRRDVTDYSVLSKFDGALKNKFSQSIGGHGSIDISGPKEEAIAEPVVRMVYLVPSDKLRREDYETAIAKAIKNLQIWYRQEMGNTLTFSLHDPVVEVFITPHTASWYANHATNSEFKYWFWENVLADGFAFTGGKFNDSKNRWIYYIDADPACGQVQGAGTSGVAELPANDLRGLAGEPRVRICPSDPIDTTPICRWVGGLGHELGHAFNLSHPSSCENNQASCPSNTLMWLGYSIYPSTYLLNENKNQLKHSQFFPPSFASQALPACGM